MKKIIIGSMRRSGGRLLGHLFDGHPDCAAFPFEYWHSRKKAALSATDLQNFDSLSPKEKVKFCGLQNEKFWGQLEANLRVPFNGDRKAQLAKLEEAAKMVRNCGAFYDEVIRWYFHDLSALPDKKRFYVNHCANLARLPRPVLTQAFGEIRLIVSIRDPRGTWASMTALKRIGGKSPLNESKLVEYCGIWRSVYTRYVTNSGNEGATMVVRFEDLVSDPVKIMTKLAAWLEIEFTETLITPTSWGEPVSANTSFQRSKAIDSSAATSWRKHLSPEDEAIIEREIGDLLKDGQYPA